MSSPEFVVYIPGMGDEPLERLDLPAAWEQLGLNVRLELIDWADTNYEERLREIGDYIIRQSGTRRTSIVGDSVGGQAALSVFARHTKHLHRAVTYSTKMESFDFSYNPRNAEDNPNLVAASNAIEEDLTKLTPEMRQRILCVHPNRDSTVAPDRAYLEGAEEHTVTLCNDVSKREAHIEGIRRGITTETHVVAEFIQQPI